MGTPSDIKIDFECTACGAKIRARVEASDVRCPNCQAVQSVPKPNKPDKPNEVKQTPASAASSTISGKAHAAPASSQPGPSRRDVVALPSAPLAIDGDATIQREQNRLRGISEKGAVESIAGDDAPQMPALDQPAVPLTPAYRRALLDNVPRGWIVPIALALVLGIMLGRAFHDLAPVGTLLIWGAAAGLLLGHLLTRWVRLRRAVVLLAQVQSLVPLGPWRLVTWRWLSHSSSGHQQPHHATVLHRASDCNFCRIDESHAIVLEHPAARRPLFVVPTHLLQAMASGLRVPAEVEFGPAHSCPKCAGTGRVSLVSVPGRWLAWLLIAIVWLNVASATWLGWRAFGLTMPVVAAAVATVAGLVVLIRLTRPLLGFGCDACRATGQIRGLPTLSAAGHVVVCCAVAWVALTPLGWQWHKAWVELPPLDEAIRTITATPAAVENLTSDELAAAGQKAKHLSVALGKAAPDTSKPRNPTAVELYRTAVKVWLLQVAELATSPANTVAKAKLVEARRDLELHMQRVSGLRRLGDAAPTLWFGPHEFNLDAILKEAARHAQAWFEPLAILFQK